MIAVSKDLRMAIYNVETGDMWKQIKIGKIGHVHMPAQPSPSTQATTSRGSQKGTSMQNSRIVSVRLTKHGYIALILRTKREDYILSYSINGELLHSYRQRRARIQCMSLDITEDRIVVVENSNHIK